MTQFRMLSSRSIRRRTVVWVIYLLASLCPLVIAQEPIIRVARISLIEGEVSYQRANDSKDDWYEADLNLPLDVSDQLYTGPDGRVEIQLSGRNIVRISKNTNLRFTQFNTGAVQLALATGTATFRIDSLDKRQFAVVDTNDGNPDEPVYFEVDSPTVAITLLREGIYRVDVKDDGTTEVIVRRGQAEVYSRELGTMTVREGRRFIIDGIDQNNFQITRIGDKDNWDRWNEKRDDDLFSRLEANRSRKYIPEEIPGVYDLDNHGEWIETPDYGWVWSPHGVSGDWAPYRHGCWRWYHSYGWTWVSHEPWGWVPYHYGRWAYWGSRWCWIPVVTSGWRWSPHHVVFFGWGDNDYRDGYRDGFRDGYWTGNRDRRRWVGWCPLGPGESRGSGHLVRDNPRSIELLRNYRAPGGLSGLEGHRFSNRRVIIAQRDLRAPERGNNRFAAARTILVQGEEIKPGPSSPVRTALIERSRNISRKLEAPVVMRRRDADTINPRRGSDSPRRPENADTPRRSAERRDDEARPGQAERSRPERGDGRAGGPPERSADNSRRSAEARDNEARPGQAERSRPDRGDERAGRQPERAADGPIVRPDRQPRGEDYRSIERINPPEKRIPREERDNQSRERGRSNDQPSRAESEQRRNDPVQQPSTPIEQPRMPRRDERDHQRQGQSNDSRPPRNIDRSSPGPLTPQPSPPTARENAPPRQVERPSSPPPSPPRESAPPRQVERPSSPPPSPPRDSAPPRHVERPSPPPRESAPQRQVERPSPPPSSPPSSPPRQVERPSSPRSNEGPR